MTVAGVVRNKDFPDAATVAGDRFRSQEVFTVPANGVHWYKVTIPVNRVIATLGRIFATDLTAMTLEVFALPVGGTLGTSWNNSNMNGRIAKTSAVLIQNYTVAPTSTGPRGDYDFVPSGGVGAKVSGGYLINNAFRIYTPGGYAVKVTNSNNASCLCSVEYSWVDVQSLADLM